MDYATFSKIDLNNSEYEKIIDELKKCIEILCKKNSSMKDELIREIDEMK